MFRFLDTFLSKLFRHERADNFSGDEDPCAWWHIKRPPEKQRWYHMWGHQGMFALANMWLDFMVFILKEENNFYKNKVKSVYQKIYLKNNIGY